MFAASSSVIVRSESLSMESWEKFLQENKGKGWRRKDSGSMRYGWFGRSEPVIFCGCFLAWQVVL